VAQGEGPKFKPQYCGKKKKLQLKLCLFCETLPDMPIHGNLYFFLNFKKLAIYSITFFKLLQNF
jgi:hypothetical protein